MKQRGRWTSHIWRRSQLGTWTQATLIGGECSHHCTTFAPLLPNRNEYIIASWVVSRIPNPARNPARNPGSWEYHYIKSEGSRNSFWVIRVSFCFNSVRTAKPINSVWLRWWKRLRGMEPMSWRKKNWSSAQEWLGGTRQGVLDGYSGISYKSDCSLFWCYDNNKFWMRFLWL